MVTLPKLGNKVYRSIVESMVQDRSNQLVDMPKNGKRGYFVKEDGEYDMVMVRQSGYDSPRYYGAFQ